MTLIDPKTKWHCALLRAFLRAPRYVSAYGRCEEALVLWRSTAPCSTLMAGRCPRDANPKLEGSSER